MEMILGIAAATVLLAELMICLMVMVGALAWAWFEFGKHIVKKIKGGNSNDQK